VNSLRVLFVIPKGSTRSSFVFAKRLGTYLAGLGVQIDVFYLASRTSPRVLVNEWRRFRREINAFRPDLIHSQFGTMTAFFCALAAGQIPLVVTYRGSDLNPCPDTAWWRSVLGKLLSQIAALRATRIICVSEELKGRLWWAKRRACVIPSGVDTSVFSPRPRDEMRVELGWGRAERVVVFNGGGKRAVKRLDLAQSAVAAAKEICGEIRFVVLDGNVDPCHVPKLLNAADCLLVTSDYEGSPTIVAEALACNLPIVSVEVGDVPWLLRDVRDSRIVKKDATEIGRALAAVLMPPRRSDGSHAVRRKRLDLQAVASRTLCVYREALGAPKWNII